MNYLDRATLLVKQYDEMLAERWLPTARQFYTGNTSLARTMLLRTGGFDPHFRRAEDVELAYRLEQKGGCFLFNPQAIGYHYASRSFASWIAIPYEYGRNDVIFTHEKGQTWLLPTIWREFHGHHTLIRALTQICLARPLLSKYMVSFLKQAAGGGQRLELTGLVNAAYSAIFNLRHYQGIADQLGGREHFFAGARAVPPTSRFASAIASQTKMENRGT